MSTDEAELFHKTASRCVGKTVRIKNGKKNYEGRIRNFSRDRKRAENKALKKEKYDQIPCLIKKGYSLSRIAKLLGISLSTVKRHKKGFHQKNSTRTAISSRKTVEQTARGERRRVPVRHFAYKHDYITTQKAKWSCMPFVKCTGDISERNKSVCLLPLKPFCRRYLLCRDIAKGYKEKPPNSHRSDEAQELLSMGSKRCV